MPTIFPPRHPPHHNQVKQRSRDSLLLCSLEDYCLYFTLEERLMCPQTGLLNHTNRINSIWSFSTLHFLALIFKINSHQLQLHLSVFNLSTTWAASSHSKHPENKECPVSGNFWCFLWRSFTTEPTMAKAVGKMQFWQLKSQIFLLPLSLNPLTCLHLSKQMKQRVYREQVTPQLWIIHPMHWRQMFVGKAVYLCS